jgi:hypothetical protein
VSAGETREQEVLWRGSHRKLALATRLRAYISHLLEIRTIRKEITATPAPRCAGPYSIFTKGAVAFLAARFRAYRLNLLIIRAIRKEITATPAPRCAGPYSIFTIVVT